MRASERHVEGERSDEELLYEPKNLKVIESVWGFHDIQAKQREKEDEGEKKNV